MGNAWHLFAADAEAAQAEEQHAALAEIRAALYAARVSRPAPARDDKRLTGWNGLAIRALAIAARHLDRDELAGVACDTVDFFRSQVVRDGRLMAVYSDGEAYQPAFLDDVAFLLDGVLELMQTRFRIDDLAFAIRLADSLLELFFDARAGGFFFTPDDVDAVVHRLKPVTDTALPAGAAVAARALIRLGYLVGETRYLAAAEETLKFAWQPMLQAPHAHMAMLNALDEHMARPDIVVIRCDEASMPQWLAPTKSYAPRRQVYLIDETISELPGALAAREPLPGGVAYLCKGPVCAPPVESARALLSHLQVDHKD